MIDVIEPVVASVVVQASPERAFVVFTQQVSTWWPTATHSLGGERTRGVTIEQRAGGRVYETWDDGTEREWGVVLDWEPGRRFAMTWGITAAETSVEVLFSPDGTGTRVEVRHAGWEALGESGAGARASYAAGWTPVLSRFAEQAA